MTNTSNKYVWRFRSTQQAVYSGNTYIHYVEDIVLYTLAYGLLAFFLGSVAAWAFDFKFYPLPPATDMLGRGFTEHFTYWCKAIINIPFSFAFKSDVETYNQYITTIKHYNFEHLLIPRIMFASFIGLLGATKGFMDKYSNPVKAVVEEHVRGLKILDGEEAEDELEESFKIEIDNSGKFAKISNRLYLSFDRLVRHLILVGNSGSGKTQYLVSLIKSAFVFQRKSKLPLKLLVMDPKVELTPAFYINDGTMAVINANHADSYVPDLGDMLRTEGLIDIFIKMIFPPKEKEDFFDSSPKELLKGLIIYLLEITKNENGISEPKWSDLSDMCDLNKEQKFYALNKYYPSAASYIGTLDENGNLVASETSDNILLSFNTAVSSVKKIGRFWYDNPNKPLKTINLTEFISNPKYGIKTLFLQTNPLDSLMGNMILRIVLMHCAKIIESLPNTKIPKGLWVCDEVHRPGPLFDLDGSPVFKSLFSIARSKGWGCNIACQSILDLESIYKPTDISAMREACSSFILTGTPLGETNKNICEFLSKAFYDKTHISNSGTGANLSTSTNIQEHAKKVLMQGELTSKLANTKTHIKYLAIFIGMPNVYILEKKFISYKEDKFDFVEREKRDGYFNPNSKVANIINSAIQIAEEMEKSKIKTADKTEDKTPNIDLTKTEEITEIDDYDNGTWIDNGQHMDPISEEERQFNEENVEGEVIKDIALETATDSHALGIGMNIVDKLTDRVNNPQNNKIFQAAMAKSKVVYKK